MAPAFPDHPALFDQRSGEVPRVPRQRVTYDGTDGVPVSHRWPGDRPSMYDTDWSPKRRRKGRRRAQRPGRAVSILIVASAVSAAAVGGVVVNGDQQRVSVGTALEQRSVAPQAASRGKVRVTPSASVSAAAPKATTKAAPKATATRPPKPVSGLNQTQMNNAAVIVKVAQDRGLPRRAMLVAVMTGLQESSLRNLANTTIPASLKRPNEGSGDDFDSLGVFQQRPSQGWGSVAELMNPRYAAGAFYERLLKVADWEEKDLGEAAQAVQRSAVPDGYDKHEERAIKVVDALL